MVKKGCGVLVGMTVGAVLVEGLVVVGGVVVTPFANVVVGECVAPIANAVVGAFVGRLLGRSKVLLPVLLFSDCCDELLSPPLHRPEPQIPATATEPITVRQIKSKHLHCPILD